jgi:putative FmdB family regulatory protein
MPFYCYRCSECGYVTEEMRCMVDRDAAKECVVCGEVLEREIEAPQVKVVNPAVPPGKKRNT